MAKIQTIIGFRLSEINTSLEFIIRKQCLEHEKLHATGTYHGKARHGMKLLKAYNKRPLVNEPKGIRKYNCKHVNMAKT